MRSRAANIEVDPVVTSRYEQMDFARAGPGAFF
jgi:hypothetical protein